MWVTPGSHGVRDTSASCFDPNFGTIGYVGSEERRRIGIACSWSSSNVSLKPRHRHKPLLSWLMIFSHLWRAARLDCSTGCDLGSDDTGSNDTSRLEHCTGAKITSRDRPAPWHWPPSPLRTRTFHSRTCSDPVIAWTLWYYRLWTHESLIVQSNNTTLVLLYTSTERHWSQLCRCTQHVAGDCQCQCLPRTAI